MKNSSCSPLIQVCGEIEQIRPEGAQFLKEKSLSKFAIAALVYAEEGCSRCKEVLLALDGGNRKGV